jgi:hypothetical protein
MAKPDAKPDALRRLGGGRWETKDGRFQVEPQSGTWVIVDTTQTNEFGLPLVRGPYGSLGAAREAIDSAREEGPVESPLADRIEQAAREAPKRPAATKPKEVAEPPKATKPPAEPKPPPEPAWLRSLHAGDRRRAKELIARLEALDIADAEAIVRAEIVDREPGLARLALERRLGAIAASSKGAPDAIAAVIQVILSGEDPDLGATWRLVDERGRRIEDLDVAGGRRT